MISDNLNAKGTSPKDELETIRIALAQINPTVGDIEGNTQKVIQQITEATIAGAQIVVLPEMVVPGYPPEDLLLKPDFIQAVTTANQRIAKASRGIITIVGTIHRERELYNTALICQNGEIAGYYYKEWLPNYGVFDEDRYFHPGNTRSVFHTGELGIGVSICEDIWVPDGPPEQQAREGGAQLLINISASPYHQQKGYLRERMLATRANDTKTFVAYCNLVGAQDELVFDGQSLILSPSGEIIVRGKPFEEELIIADLDLRQVQRHRLFQPRRRCTVETQKPIKCIQLTAITQTEKTKSPTPLIDIPDPIEEVYKALVLGIRDTINKWSFKSCTLGLSGGVDSALVATLAVDAIGAENVTVLAMPSRYSSSHSLEDAQILSKNLGLDLQVVSIEPMYQAFIDSLKPFFGDGPIGKPGENLQARVRGMLLMAFTNKFGGIVLTTSNKSEVGTGYTTLYGDAAGGFAAIKDVPKMLVYELCRWRNRQAGYNLIPERILIKAPSGELKEDHKDSDALPIYPILDPIMKLYVEQNCAPEEIISHGFTPDEVRLSIRLIDTNEYKRRQMPPGIKITERAFGKDWRVPITNKYQY